MIIPSWDIHAEINGIFGIPSNISNNVDKIIDLKLHDLGRRLSKKRDAEMRSLLIEITATRESEKAFFLHHLLDSLSLRIASTLILKLDPLKYKREIFRGVSSDLRVTVNKIQRYIPILISINDLEREFNEKLPIILRNQKLVNWVRENLINPRISRERIPLNDAVMIIYSKTLKMKKGYVKSANKSVKSLAEVYGRGSIQIKDLSEIHENVIKATADRYMYSELYVEVFKLVSYKSRLYDYMVLLGYPLDFIYERLFRVSKRRAAFLGREYILLSNI